MVVVSRLRLSVVDKAREFDEDSHTHMHLLKAYGSSGIIVIVPCKDSLAQLIIRFPKHPDGSER